MHKIYTYTVVLRLLGISDKSFRIPVKKFAK